jgi:chromosome segregation ATPase
MPVSPEKPVKFQIGAAPSDNETLSEPALTAPRARSGARWLLFILLVLAIAVGAYGYHDLKRSLKQNQFTGSEIEKNMKAFSAQQQQRIDQANTQLATLEKHQAELVETLQKNTTELEAAQKALEKKADQEVLAKEASSREQMEKSLAGLAGVDKRLEALDARIDTISSDLGGEVKEISLLLNDTAKSVIDLKSAVDQVAQRSDPGDLKKVLQGQIAALEKQLKQTNAAVAGLSDKVAGLASATAAVKQTVARYDGELIKMKKDLSLYDDTILRLTSQVRNMESRLDTLSLGMGQEILREQNLSQ